MLSSEGRYGSLGAWDLVSSPPLGRAGTTSAQSRRVSRPDQEANYRPKRLSGRAGRFWEELQRDGFSEWDYGVGFNSDKAGRRVGVE